MGPRLAPKSVHPVLQQCMEDCLIKRIRSGTSVVAHEQWRSLDESVEVESGCLVSVDEFDLAADGELRILEVVPARS